jgi:hypothetical protein
VAAGYAILGASANDRVNRPALTCAADLDQVDALAPEREALWARLEKSSFLTDAEKRLAVGYPAMPDASSAPKYNPNHGDDGRFTFSPDGATIDPVAYKPRTPTPPPPPPKPPTPPPTPATPTAPRADPGTTPKGRRFTEHAREEANKRGFADDRIDAIVDNNKRISNGIDELGRKTWRHTDNRGNTVILNEEGGVVTVFSPVPGGIFIPKP